ncbi:MAG: hypothetical protein L6R37_003825 [Teloschistes peruensis]|nr:MAG: hypothetical protein L6R37_003825 [Teloschistes peruensis]
MPPVLPFVTILLLTCLPPAFSRVPTCLPNRPRPLAPKVNDCQSFISSLSRDARAEPHGAYKWYGRDVDPGPGFVHLPAIIHSSHQKCATLIDVDEEAAKEASVFGLDELAVSLAGLMQQCWIIEKLDGRAWPGGGQAAWAAFVLGYEWVGVERWGNRTVDFVDFDELKRGERASE